MGSRNGSNKRSAARIKNAVVQRTLMDNHPPLGEDSEVIRSQIDAENGAVGEDRGDSGDTRMASLLEESTVVRLVEEAGVPPAAVPRVGASTTAMLAGISSPSPRLTRGDLMTNIERSRDRQSAGIAEALGSVLNSIINPARTLRDITTDFETASRNLRTAVGSEKEFWTEAQQSLLIEMRSLNSN